MSHAQDVPEFSHLAVPIVQEFTAKTTGIEGTVTEIVMLPDGDMAFMDETALVIFNGTRWQRIPSPQQTMLRTILVLPDDRIILGSEDGLLQLVFHQKYGYELEHVFPPERLSSQNPFITCLVYSREHLFMQYGEDLHILAPDGALTHASLGNWSNGVFASGDDIFVLGGKNALIGKWDWKKNESIVIDDTLEKAGLEWLLRSTPRSEGGAWLVTEEQNIFGFNGTEAWKWPGCDYLHERNIKVRSVLEIGPNRLAIGTTSYGILIFDTNGRFIRSLGAESNDAVLAMSADAQGGFWGATPRGIMRAESHQQAFMFDKRHGLSETIHQIALFNGEVYLATQGGLYASNSSATVGRDLFYRKFDLQYVRDLISVDDCLFIGGDSQLGYLTVDGQLNHLSEDTVNCLIRPKNRPDIILAGTDRGIVWVKRNGSQWVYQGLVEDLGTSVHSFAQGSDGTIWCSQMNLKIARIQTVGDIPAIEEVESYTTSQVRWNMAAEVEGEIVISRDPALKWLEDSKSFEAVDDIAYFGDLEAPFGFQQLFIKNEKEIFVCPSKANANTVPRPNRRVIGYISTMGDTIDHQANCLLYDENGGAWIGSRFGLIYDLAPLDEDSAIDVPPPHLDRIVDLKTKRSIPLPPEGQALWLAPDLNDLRFEVSFQNFITPSRNEYSITLEGYENGEVQRGFSAFRDYTNLPHGEYTLRVQSRLPNGLYSPEIVYPISIQTPLHLTAGAFSLYAIALILLIVLCVKANSLRHKRRNAALEREVADRTVEITQKNKEIEERAEELADTLKILRETQQQLLETARDAGKAQVASDVLHEVGHALNSVNINVHTLAKRCKDLDIDRLRKIVDLISGQRDDLATFISNNPKGRLIPQYLEHLTGALTRSTSGIIDELEHLEGHVKHITNIVIDQRAYATPINLIETVELVELCSQALETAIEDVEENPISVSLPQGPSLEIATDRKKVLDILVCLLKNASDSIKQEPHNGTEPNISIEIDSSDEAVLIQVRDTGCGFDPAQKRDLFQQKKDIRIIGGHISLHKAANCASSLKGRLNLESEGLGLGSVATLQLPLNQ